MTDVERQSMIDMGYSEEQIKEVEDNPRRGGRFAKGGKIGFDGLAKKVAKKYEGKPVKEKFQSEYGKTYSKAEAMEVGKKVAGKVYRQQQSMAKGGEVLVVKTKKGLKTMKDFQDFSKDEIKEWGTERGLKYNAKGEKFGGQALKVDEFFVKPRSRYNAVLPSSNHAKGGEIKMSEIYNVNGKDYLFSTPIQNAKGTYTGWDAYEVVYDTFDGEKHLNYTKTKKGKSKYFPNGVKRTEAEDSFAKGGYLEGKTYYIVDYYSSVSDIPNGIAIKNKSFDTKKDANTFLKSIENKGGRGFVTDFRKPTRDEIDKLDRDRNENYMMSKGGKTQGYNDNLDESLGNTKGKRSTKEQNYKDRRNESEAMKKKGGKRKYSSVKTMDKGSRSKRKTPLTLAKEIRKEGEKWQDAVKRASAILKKEAK
jgi:hypothetical protein